MHPDLATEQEYLDRAHDHLAVMQATATRLAERFQQTAKSDFNDAAVEHTMRRDVDQAVPVRQPPRPFHASGVDPDAGGAERAPRCG